MMTGSRYKPIGARRCYVKPLVVVTNESAGGTAEEAVGAALSVLSARTDVRREVCAEPGDLDGVLDGLGDGEILVVAGGDGSVHTAVAALHRRGRLAADRPLGLVPLGTGNDLARTLGIPLDPADAARALLAGTARALDLVVDDGDGVVVNAVHLGIGAEAAAKAGAFKDRLGAAAYAVGSVAAGVRPGGWSLHVEVDGTTVHVDGEVLMVGVANGRTIGGGAELAPDASPDDGLLDVVVATSTGPLARLGFATSLREGDHVERDDVLVVRGRSVTVSGDEFPVNADGELYGPVSSRTWTIRPRSWAVLAPR
jgi:YegS/Rv2252/BmrU family lipid kinase